MSESTGLLRVDLKAIAENWRRLKNYVGADPAAVVKADAYGLGMLPVASALYQTGCRDFFVATLEEALLLRSHLSAQARCLVLGGAPAGAEQTCVEQHLLPVINSIAALRRWQSSVGAAPCALKFDTGMTRLGLPLEALQDREYRDLLAAANVMVAMSHLACAEARESEHNTRQQAAFTQVRQMFAPLWPRARWSLANSSGIFLGKDYHADLVRPGASLYGFNPCPGRASPVRPVVTLQLPVLQLRALEAPAAVGYGAAGKMPSGALLAVAAGGYADGLQRVLGTEGKGFCEGVEVPVVGRVAMDTTVFDVSAVPAIKERWMQSSDSSLTIDILTSTHNVSEVSARNASLGYEVLTSLGSHRYRRDYLPLEDAVSDSR